MRKFSRSERGRVAVGCHAPCFAASRVIAISPGRRGSVGRRDARLRHVLAHGRPARRASVTIAPVTVGLPVFNGERYLSAAIESILTQTFHDLSLVISDNG